jgi:transcriptional regulator with XRE-family HTH domain/Zn-dependent peptidase ImmA (M78 family)
MIKNERQYRITKSQAEKFADAIRRVEKAPSSANPLVVKASREALESQLADLHSEIEEYERLLTGDVHLVEVESFQELPAALIRARIAAGLSQRDLGERLDMKEQQIQRYEATDFAGASFSTLSAIVNALGVSMREDILVPTEHLTVNKFLTRLEGFGLDKTFVQKRLFPRDAASPPSAGQQTGELLFKTAANLKRVYGWSLGESVGTAIPKFDVATAGAARFKIPARVADQRLSAYTIYAYHLSTLALQVTPNLESKPIPRKPSEVAAAIAHEYGELSLSTALDYVWGLGIAVLPLQDAGAFHGAFWRMQGRGVIVLKQQTKSEARWLFDLLHELWHAGEEPDQPERSLLELPETDPDRRQSTEEKHASMFAGNVVLAGRAEELVNIVLKETDGLIPRFKATVQKVADREGVSAASLANYIAFRLSLQEQNWWGTASNLQPQGDPWTITRDAFLLRCDFSQVNLTDRELLSRALEEPEATA